MTDKAKADVSHSAGYQPGMSKKLAKGAVLIGGVKGLSLVLAVFSTLILARLLAPEDFGLIAIGMTLMALVVNLSELSLSEALIQMDDIDEEHYHTAFTLGVLRSVFLAIVIASLAKPAAGLYGDERLENIFFAFAGAAVLSGFSNPRVVDLARNLDFRADFALSLSERIASFTFAVGFAILLQSYWALIIAFYAAQSARLITSYAIIGYLPKFSLKRYKGILNFSIWVTLGKWMQTVSWRSDPLILGLFIPVSVLGQYDMSKRLNRMATQELLMPIAHVLFPAFSRIKDNPHRLRNAYLKALSILSSVAIPIAAGMGVLATPLVKVVLSEKWMPTIPLIQILALIAVINSTQYLRPLAMAVSRTKSLFFRDFAYALIRMPMLLIGLYAGPKFGLDMLEGALLGVALSATINMIWNMQLISRLSYITIADHSRVLWRPMLSGMGMTLIVYVMLHYSTVRSFSALSQLGLLTVSGALIYALLLLTSWVISGKPEGIEATALEVSAKVLKKNG